MDKNTEIEQYFALWNESFPVAATHDHWVRWGKLLRVWLPSIDGVPMNVEVTGDFPRALKKREPLELELRLLFLKGSFYKDEAEMLPGRKVAYGGRIVHPVRYIQPDERSGVCRKPDGAYAWNGSFRGTCGVGR